MRLCLLFQDVCGGQRSLRIVSGQNGSGQIARLKPGASSLSQTDTGAACCSGCPQRLHGSRGPNANAQASARFPTPFILLCRWIFATRSTYLHSVVDRSAALAQHVRAHQM